MEYLEGGCIFRKKHFAGSSLVGKAAVWNILFPPCMSVCSFPMQDQWGTNGNTGANHKETPLIPRIFYHRRRHRTRYKVKGESSVLENMQTSVWFNLAKTPVLLFLALFPMLYALPNDLSPQYRKACFSPYTYISLCVTTKLF